MCDFEHEIKRFANCVF